MKVYRCSYCDASFEDEKAYVTHLSGPGWRCMNPIQMQARGFVRGTKGWRYTFK